MLRQKRWQRPRKLTICTSRAIRGKNSHINVGCVKDVATRVRSIETGHNIKLRVLAIFPGQGRLEHKLHALLSDHRAADGRGQEWFNVTLQQALSAAALAMTFARSDDAAY